MPVIKVDEYYIETGNLNNPWWELTPEQKLKLNLVLNHPEACEETEYGHRVHWGAGIWIGHAGPGDHDEGWDRMERQLVYYNPGNPVPKFRTIRQGLEILTAVWQNGNKRQLEAFLPR